LSGDLFQESRHYTTRRQALSAPHRCTSGKRDYECSVKVFNSSVEIRVEKHPAMMEIMRRNRGLLLFAQVLVQSPIFSIAT
jgi:hypothetical protein